MASEWRKSAQIIEKQHLSLCFTDYNYQDTMQPYLHMVMAFVKLEAIRGKSGQSVCLQSKLYLSSLKAAFDELNTIRYAMQVALDF